MARPIDQKLFLNHKSQKKRVAQSKKYEHLRLITLHMHGDDTYLNKGPTQTNKKDQPPEDCFLKGLLRTSSLMISN